MSLMIRGMKMPEDDRPHRALFTVKDGKAIVIIESAEDYAERTADVYDLVELPTHGRLIDADALEHLLSNAIGLMKLMAAGLNAEDDPEIKMELKAYNDILNGIKEQKTIIEASDSES